MVVQPQHLIDLKVEKFAGIDKMHCTYIASYI